MKCLQGFAISQPNSHPDGCWYEASEDGSFVSLRHGDKFKISVQLNELPLNCWILNGATSDHVWNFGELVDCCVDAGRTSADWNEDERNPNSLLFFYLLRHKQADYTYIYLIFILDILDFSSSLGW